MPLENLLPRNPYEGAHADYDTAEVVIIGAGYDGTSTYRPGSRFAPVAIRSQTLYSQEDYSPYFDMDLKDRHIHDAGDLDLPFGNREAALAMIRQVAQEVFRDGKKPFFIGGEHLITLPVIQAAVDFYPDLRIVQIDAHLDMIDELWGEKISHGTVMRRSQETLGQTHRIYQVAVRSGSKEEFAFARRTSRVFPFNTREFLPKVKELRSVPVYLTVDLDAFDPSLLPGTGTPEAGGIFFPEFIEFLKALQGCRIVGCDMVELAPQIDPTNNSTAVAAKSLREMLMIL